MNNTKPVFADYAVLTIFVMFCVLVVLAGNYFPIYQAVQL